MDRKQIIDRLRQNTDAIRGMAHDMGDRPARDERRDAFLRSRGFAVLRIPAAFVLTDLTADG